MKKLFRQIFCTGSSTGSNYVQASNVSMSSVSWGTATINFTNGGGVSRLVVMSLSPITDLPTNGVVYTPNTAFGQGHEIGWYVYAVGNASGVSVTGLTENTTYYVRVFEIYGSNTNCQCVYVTTNNSISFTTEDKPFEPSDIAWKQAFLQADLTTYTSGGNIWINRGSQVGNAIQNGSDPVPTYNGTELALEFTRASSQHLVFQKASPVMSQPWTLIARLKRKTTGSFQTPVGFSNGYALEFNGSNLINGVAGTAIPAGTWYVIEIVYNGTSSTIRIDNGSPITWTSNTYSHGTEMGRMGSTYANTNYFDGYIRDIYVGTPTTEELTDMRSWITTNWL